MLWLLLILGAILLLSYSCYWVTFYNPVCRHMEPVEHSKSPQHRQYLNRLNELSGKLEQIPCEQVRITAHDGITLAARYYHLRDGAPLVIQFHGYRGSGIRDFCGGCTLAMELGYNVLLVDQRAHGCSGGNTMSFGILERYDCKKWAEYAVKRLGNDVKIILYGISMGAATVLMALSLQLPGQVAGVIADSPFSSPGAIIRKVCGDIRLPHRMIYPFVALGAMIFGRFRIWEMDSERAVKNTKTPILLIHGGDDRFVPSQMSRRIADAAEQARVEIFPGAGHALSFASDEARYRNLLKDFVEFCTEMDN